jgi:hypothetical protein
VTIFVLSRIGFNLIKIYRIYNRIVVLCEFHYYLCISHVPPDDGLSCPQHVVSGIIKTSDYVAVTPPFLHKAFLK